jgi:hypothetical protein
MTLPALPQAALEALAVDAKIGLVATVDDGGRPHVSLITSLAGRDPGTLMYGQFCEGWSKSLVRRNPRVAWLIMDKARGVWRGTATWREAKKTGPEVDLYNQKPLFRYNSYFGIHTVHLLDVAGSVEHEVVGLAPLIGAGLLARASSIANRRRPDAALKPWAGDLLNALPSVKFLAWVRPDGFPHLVPAVAAASADGTHVDVADAAHRAELREMPAGTSVALLVVNLKLESVHLRGAWTPRRALGPLARGRIAVDQVYNSMPPLQGVIWPEEPLVAVTEF